jgi:hypothetical protein
MKLQIITGVSPSAISYASKTSIMVDVEHVNVWLVQMCECVADAVKDESCDFVMASSYVRSE